MSRYADFADTDLAALGLGGPNDAEIAQLRATRDALIPQIRAIFDQRPDLRGRQPVSLDTKAQNLVELRGVVQRLQTALAWLQAQVAAGAGGGGGGSSGGGGAGPNDAEIAALRAKRDQLIQVLRIAWHERPDLRARVPVSLDTKAANLVELRGVVQRLQRAVEWLEAQPEPAQPSAPVAAVAPVAIAAAKPATWSPQNWSVWAQVSPWLSAPTWGRPPNGAPARRAGSSSLPCGMGSWLSKAFKKVTGQNLSSVVAPIAANIPYVGGLVSNIVSGGGSAGQVAQQVAQAVGLTQAQVQHIAAGKPCQGVSAEKRAACQAEIQRIAAGLRDKYKAAPGSAPCAHLPAALKTTCQNERRSAWERVVSAMNAGQPVPPAAFAALTPQEQAQVQTAATAAASSPGLKLSGPLALAAAGIGILALSGRGR